MIPQFRNRNIGVQSGPDRIYQHFKIVINAAFQRFDKLVINFINHKRP
jgi:hypothetical protein